MAEKNEIELDQEALDKLMQGVSPGIEPAIIEEETQSPAKETEAEIYPRLQPETYSKADIQKLMDEHNHYIASTPTEADKDKFNEEFEQTVIGGSKDVEDFATGLLSAEPDALDDMEKYIELFGKEYINGFYQYTPAAHKAMQRLKVLREEAKEKALSKTQEQQKAEAEKENANKSNTAKIKELMAKKPQERTLEDYLFLKEAIGNNPRRTAEQKIKDIEGLTSQARIRMKNPNSVKASELSAVPAFIEAFGYDKGYALNKDARNFRQSIAERTPAQQKAPVQQEAPVQQAIDSNQVASNTPTMTKEKNKKRTAIFGWIKDKANRAKEWIKRNPAPIIVGLLASSSLFGLRSGSNNEDNNPKSDKVENIVHANNKTYDGGTLPEVVITAENADINMLKQYAKRIGHQEKMSTEDTVKRTMNDFQAFKELPDTVKSKLSGKTDEEKLAKLGVVRGDQDKLHKPIDQLLSGEKINPLTLKDISERTFKVTDDFGANKDNNLENGTQTIQMSAYQIQKAYNNQKAQR